MAKLKDCQMLEVEINSIRRNLSDLGSVAFVGIVIFKLLSEYIGFTIACAAVW